MLFLPLLALSLPLQAAPVGPRIAVLQSGKRVPCTATTAVGDRFFATPYGSFLSATDPVAEVVDGSEEAGILREVRAIDFSAWLRRIGERGLVEELVRAAGEEDLGEESREQILDRLENWGRLLDPVPPKLPADRRVDWVWEHLEENSAGRSALLCGRLLEEIPGAGAPSSRRVGLVALRRALRSGKAPLIRTAARVGARQEEQDLLRPLLATSLGSGASGARHAAAQAAQDLNEGKALGQWTLTLLRGRRDGERVRAAEFLGHSAAFAAVEPLIAAVASARRAPGRFAFFGRQISLVTDFNVEVAQAAAIADPVVNVLTEGSVLEVRILSTTVSRAAMRGLRRLTGADPGPREEDWLRWYRARKMARE